MCVSLVPELSKGSVLPFTLPASALGTVPGTEQALNTQLLNERINALGLMSVSLTPALKGLALRSAQITDFQPPPPPHPRDGVLAQTELFLLTPYLKSSHIPRPGICSSCFHLEYLLSLLPSSQIQTLQDLICSPYFFLSLGSSPEG